MRVSILNAGEQTDYLYGIVSGLSSIPTLDIEVVDSDNAVGVIDVLPNVTLFNLRGDNLSPQSSLTKAWRIGRYYLRLLLYTARTSSEIFHIQWENSFAVIDRTLLLLYYKMFGKKIVFTAHNIYKEERDGRASPLRRFSLWLLYHLVDHIVVHTAKMKEELCSLFHVVPEKVAVISHGINNRIPRKGVAQEEARRQMDIELSAHVVLFFGQIDSYKGIETLIDAVAMRVKEDASVILLLAGKPKRQSDYVQNLKRHAVHNLTEKNLKLRFEYIPVDEVEKYFAAADCLVLPYKKIFQSGVIFLSYRFGIPIIATDVGSFHDDIIDGVTGFLCAPESAEDMSEKLRIFFESDLFHQREQTRTRIRELAEQKYSWTDIAQKTNDVYRNVVQQP
jgi:D-inositol-3-phosphate glycosyltransferase